MAEQVVLCRLEDIADPGSKGFAIDIGGEQRRFFIVRKGTRVFAYVNACPHRGTPLDWKPDSFLDIDRERIQCASHGALFRMEDGFCTAGPCAAKSLEPFPIDVVDGRIVIRP
ncbi:MAG: Rieske (2Fe-2S) protein [Alphaproteobacteria bacterium]|nr:Rieske (2Fe-2S) protein [Alphaproteobacteria bacterium]